jgi:hypothetical protein
VSIPEANIERIVSKSFGGICLERVRPGGLTFVEDVIEVAGLRGPLDLGEQ